MAKTAAAKPTAAVAAPKDEKDVVSDASESEQPKPKAKRAPANGVKKAKNTTAKPKAKKTTAAKATAEGPTTPTTPKNPSIADMTTMAFTSLKDRKGNSLASIRNYIATEYKRVISKALQGHIKKFIAKEFEEGRIRMTNSDEETINFAKRFALVKKTATQ